MYQKINFFCENEKNFQTRNVEDGDRGDLAQVHQRQGGRSSQTVQQHSKGKS
jgi:hypothetical protein